MKVMTTQKTRQKVEVPRGIQPPAFHGPPTDGPPRDQTPHGADWSMRRASATAGIGLLLMIVPAFLGNFVALEGLVTPGDAARTAADITASEVLFRFGIANLFAVVVLDIIVAVALYRVFVPVSAGIATLAAAARLVYAGIFMVAISQLVGVANLLGGPESIAVVSSEHARAQAWLGIEAYRDTWNAGLLVFGLHLLLLGRLAWRSGYVPRVVAVLLGVAGVGYAFDTVAAVLVGHGAPTIAEFTFLGEVLLAIWLIRWSRCLARGQARPLGARA
jgi:hypothetical protein